MRVNKAVRTASVCVDEMLNIGDGESVVVVADESGVAENGEIIEAVLGLSRQRGADADLVVMRDTGPREGNVLTPVVCQAMREADIVVGCTYTTWAGAYYHEVPMELVEAGSIRVLGLVKRSWEALTGPHILEVDYEENLRVAKAVARRLDDGSEIVLTSAEGTELSADIDGKEGMYEDVAHEPGDVGVLSGIGEAEIGPIVGSPDGSVVVDGPVGLEGSPWPSPPLELEIRDGVVRNVTGDERVVTELEAIFETTEHADNVAEIGIGINPHSALDEFQVWKKRRGTAHIGVGDGLYYGQDVASRSHIDFVMNEPTVAVDGETILSGGELHV